MPDSFWDVTHDWRVAWPGATGGVLALRGFRSDERNQSFDDSLSETENMLRERYATMEREAIRNSGNFTHYHRYYRSFGQNYHVQYQIESIAKKGRKIPRRQLLVEIGFKWELRNGILTGVHDFDAVELPVELDAPAEPVSYTGYGGDDAEVRQRDMHYRDGRSVLSSIIGGPSQHGRVNDSTTAALFTVYGVPGVSAEAVEAHLRDMWADVRLVSPGTELVELSTRTSS